MKLALGTVQFGLNYGISNKSGQTSNKEIKEILDYAAQVGIDLLDTAPAYGTSEQAIGEGLPHNHAFKIVTKTPVVNKCNIRQQVTNFETTFINSLNNLKSSSVYGLLLHNVDDILQPNGKLLWTVMEKFKAQGYVSKIGVSVYNGQQIDKLLDSFPIDLIQLPLNVFDQRLIKNGHLSRLKSLGIEIHARSVFLQGLLLMSPQDIPAKLQIACNMIRDFHKSSLAFNLSPLQSALMFASKQPEIDKIVVGINNLKQLEEMCFVATNSTFMDYEKFACDNEAIINPSKW